LGATELPSGVFSTTSFILLVLLGLGFSLSPADYEMEVEAGRATLRCAGVGGVAMVALMHLKCLDMLLPHLRRADLGERHVVMWYDREGVHVPFLEVPLLSFFPDLEWRHGGAALYPSSSMVEFKVSAADSLHR
jgi:hypothetical protein